MPAAPGVGALPNGKQQPIARSPEAKIRFEPLEPEPAAAADTAKSRGRALFLTLLAAVLVAAACLLAVLLWRRRNMAEQLHAESMASLESVPDDFPDDFPDDLPDDFADDVADDFPDNVADAYADEDSYSAPK